MKPEEYEKLGHNVVDCTLSTPCIICGNGVALTDIEARGVCIKVCDECKQAILFAKEMKEMCQQKEPEVEVLNEIDRIYRCPECHKHFIYKKQKFCDNCGQAVKWE